MSSILLGCDLQSWILSLHSHFFVEPFDEPLSPLINRVFFITPIQRSPRFTCICIFHTWESLQCVVSISWVSSEATQTSTQKEHGTHVSSTAILECLPAVLKERSAGRRELVFFGVAIVVMLEKLEILGLSWFPEKDDQIWTYGLSHFANENGDSQQIWNFLENRRPLFGHFSWKNGWKGNRNNWVE